MANLIKEEIIKEEIRHGSKTTPTSEKDSSANGVCSGLIFASLLAIIATCLYSNRHEQNAQLPVTSTQAQISQAQSNSNPLYAPAPPVTAP